MKEIKTLIEVAGFDAEKLYTYFESSNQINYNHIIILDFLHAVVSTYCIRKNLFYCSVYKKLNFRKILE